MKILIGCEFSGVVRKEFRDRGHDAWSCDIITSEDSSPYHYQCSLLQVLYTKNWDMLIAFPPCTNLASSGARWFSHKVIEQRKSIDFVKSLWLSKIEKIAIENPIGILSTQIRKPDQIIQPWQFGHGETKATCLWLKNLTKLVPTNIVEGRYPRVHKMAPGPNRGRERSRTYYGIANAMADQWG